MESVHTKHLISLALQCTFCYTAIKQKMKLSVCSAVTLLVSEEGLTNIEIHSMLFMSFIS